MLNKDIYNMHKSFRIVFLRYPKFFFIKQAKN